MVSNTDQVAFLEWFPVYSPVVVALLECLLTFCCRVNGTRHLGHFVNCLVHIFVLSRFSLVSTSDNVHRHHGKTSRREFERSDACSQIFRAVVEETDKRE